MKKSELRKMIKEELLKEGPFDRMEGLATLRYLNDLHVSLKMLTREWEEEGFERIDIIKYVSTYIKKIR